MIEYLNGKLVEIFPTHVIVEVNGVGYHVHISLNTFTSLTGRTEAKVLIHEVIREDSHLLYGFFSSEERELFRMLISVSGVGASTGILFVSSLAVAEIKLAIISGDIEKLKSIKGVGLKTAQRIVVELKEKLAKEPVSNDIFSLPDNSNRLEALSALVTLGFARKEAEKTVDAVLRKNPEITVEQIIKDALKQM
ncbi:MAG TPA: Holliday junction branch migration protein RuvA [Prolixibacteraceae bacterium]|nr:Holliday junction branch migration protein RuvA [Bacteroidales bacterium]HPB04632.1 Holliday junction branch migration protein RuvA [Prolixibacteraceae bacterium]HQN92707.1 Holliday junction branch migration protein RuvA [Prolixibacteraceae bacterium]HUM88003.1 Holliday junction branch migration protein RuvA [Prolixibacteraceae bacterium]